MLTDKEQHEIWRKDPNNWLLGFIYFNKEDKREIVEKRTPQFGITFNFAHRNAHFYFIGMLLFFGFIVFVITYFGK